MIFEERHQAEAHIFVRRQTACAVQEKQNALKHPSNVLSRMKYIHGLKRSYPLENNNTQRLVGMLGFAMRAGKITTGFDLSCRALASGKARLCAVTEDASAATKKRLRTKSEFYGVPYVTLPLTRDRLAALLGKVSPTAAIAILDEGFAEQIIKATDAANS